eukprot:4647850-Amphidinium_carterae.2
MPFQAKNRFVQTTDVESCAQPKARLQSRHGAAKHLLLFCFLFSQSMTQEAAMHAPTPFRLCKHMYSPEYSWFTFWATTHSIQIAPMLGCELLRLEMPWRIAPPRIHCGPEPIWDSSAE